MTCSGNANWKKVSLYILNLVLLVTFCYKSKLSMDMKKGMKNSQQTPLEEPQSESYFLSAGYTVRKEHPPHDSWARRLPALLALENGLMALRDLPIQTTQFSRQ